MSVHRPTPQRQRGATLMVGLILLLVLTMLGVAAMRAASMEERMTNNTQDLQIAFQVGEAALREGEMLVQQPALPPFDGTNGLYLFEPPDSENPQTPYVPRWKRAGTVWRNATVTAGAPPEPLDKARGQFIVEEVLVTQQVAAGESLSSDTAPESRERIYYRVTARAWGATGAANPLPMVVLQSTFER